LDCPPNARTIANPDERTRTMTEQERAELLELLEEVHAEGDHDVEADPDCPACIAAAEESARLVREAKKSPAKKTAPKKSAAPTVSSEHQGIVDDWKNGTTLAQIAQRTQLKRSTIRTIITNALGGKDAFKSFRAQGGGGLGRGRARQAARSIRDNMEPDTFVIEDFGVPRITSCRKSDGWKYHRIKTGYDSDGHPVSTEVHTAPDGTEYVVAQPGEAADLVRDFVEGSPAFGMPSTRFRRLDRSSTLTMAATTQRQDEARQEKDAQKKPRRVSRKTA
jgi:hypothetical protein